MTKLILYTTKGHKVPVDIEATQMPVIVLSTNTRYFACSIQDGTIKMDGDRYIYLEVAGFPLGVPVTPL